MVKPGALIREGIAPGLTGGLFPLVASLKRQDFHLIIGCPDVVSPRAPNRGHRQDGRKHVDWEHRRLTSHQPEQRDQGQQEPAPRREVQKGCQCEDQYPRDTAGNVNGIALQRRWNRG